MINVIEILIDYIKNFFIDDFFFCLYIGEIMGCWLYFIVLVEEIFVLEICFNIIMNSELFKFIYDLKNLVEFQIDIFKKLMIKEGIFFFEILVIKLKFDFNSILLGVKVMDFEIVNLIFVKIVFNIVMCSMNMG